MPPQPWQQCGLRDLCGRGEVSGIFPFSLKVIDGVCWGGGGRNALLFNLFLKHLSCSFRKLEGLVFTKDHTTYNQHQLGERTLRITSLFTTEDQFYLDQFYLIEAIIVGHSFPSYSSIHFCY